MSWVPRSTALPEERWRPCRYTTLRSSPPESGSTRDTHIHTSIHTYIHIINWCWVIDITFFFTCFFVVWMQYLENSHYGPKKRVKVFPVRHRVSSIRFQTELTAEYVHSQDTATREIWGQLQKVTLAHRIGKTQSIQGLSRRHLAKDIQFNLVNFN